MKRIARAREPSTWICCSTGSELSPNPISSYRILGCTNADSSSYHCANWIRSGCIPHSLEQSPSYWPRFEIRLRFACCFLSRRPDTDHAPRVVRLHVHENHPLLTDHDCMERTPSSRRRNHRICTND